MSLELPGGQDLGEEGLSLFLQEVQDTLNEEHGRGLSLANAEQKDGIGIMRKYKKVHRNLESMTPSLAIKACFSELL